MPENIFKTIKDPDEASDAANRSDFFKSYNCDVDNKQSRAKNNATKGKLDIDKDDVAKGLGKLVLTVVEFLRELMERQAIRRMDNSSLTDEEINNLGDTFEQLNEKIDELKKFFGIEDDDLNIDLGPLGKLL